jgi:2-methylcitrate dehydratase PrpD
LTSRLYDDVPSSRGDVRRHGVAVHHRERISTLSTTEHRDTSDGGTSPGPTTRLARFLATTTLADIPEDVLERSAHITLDGIGCALVGAHLPWSERAVDGVAALESGGPAAVIGWGLDLTATAAALLNSTFIQGFELDDYHELGPLHSASVVLPAVFATASALDNDVTGAEMALAIAIGFEVGPRIGAAMRGHAMLGHGWHSGAVYGGLAAAAAAAKLRGLDADGFEDALGIASTQASGLMSAQFESMVKRMNHAFGARNGVLAAALADSGFTGIKDVLERPYGGFFAMFADDHPTNVEEVAAELGERWEILRVLVKPYASGGTTHPVIDAILRARNQLGIRESDVRAITIRLTHDSFHHNGWRLERPTTSIGAQLNVAYVAAVAMLDGAVFVPQFTPSRLEAEDVWSLIERTEVINDPEVDALAKRSGTPRATRVSIACTDGRMVELEVLEARGTRSLALSNEEIREKFRGLVTELTGAPRAAAIEEQVLALAEADSANDLLELLRAHVEPLD